MAESRREFIDRIALGAAAMGGLSLGLGAVPRELRAEFAPGVARSAGASAGATALNPNEWDTRWPQKLTGKIRTVFDVPEVESGYGVWRASIWAAQYNAVLGTPVADMSTALVLRHNAIVLAMQQSFWDEYGIGKSKGVTHPVTQEPTDRNPALLASSRGEQPADFDSFALTPFMERGGVVLACDLALRDCIGLIEKTKKVSAEEARRQAIAMLVPGVILQPSGVFAAFLAQQAGAMYIRAS